MTDDLDSLVKIWPATGLGIRAGDLEMRWPDDDLLVKIAAVASRGVHDPDRMPFTFPWTRGTPLEVARNVLTYNWSARRRIDPKDLLLEFAVLVDGEVVGTQGGTGKDWGVLREVETGSWLGLEFHGRGIGKRMRILMLHLLFEGLGADDVTSTAMEDNPESNAVSCGTGYEPDGVMRVVRDGAPVRLNRWRITRDRWESLRDEHARILGAPVEMRGVDAVRAQLEPTTKD
ncbi:GNAT family N-acetyltransferase [Microbacterium sp. ASV49]|uniref:GNAT family protein n=1 Tax=Microbacterium candidum TaxID=3041922 RepID=A0ABT7N358_9MICO|nr:GNAT family protein [Microbacterium sp. ASV49]MDL9981106.1 GNAT family protein [Microbacterium sp. ASV49]